MPPYTDFSSKSTGFYSCLWSFEPSDSSSQASFSGGSDSFFISILRPVEQEEHSTPHKDCEVYWQIHLNLFLLQRKLKIQSLQHLVLDCLMAVIRFLIPWNIKVLTKSQNEGNTLLLLDLNFLATEVIVKLFLVPSFYVRSPCGHLRFWLDHNISLIYF